MLMNSLWGGGGTTESSTQDSKEVKKVNLGRSVVSATGYEQDIKDAPASISIIDREEILTRPVRDLGDIVQDVPGVYVEASKTGANTISMRGLASGYTLILVDGKRQNVAQGFGANGIDATTSFMPPANMIERVEVIRGPASVIYGSDAMGGVINIITKKHSDETTAGIQLDTRLAEESDVFGNIYGFNAYLNAPLVKDKLSLNLRGGYKYGEQNAFLKPAYILANQTGTSRANPYLGWSATGFTQYNLGGRINFTPNKNNYIYLDSEMYFGRYGSLNTSGNSITAVRDFTRYNNILSHEASYDWGKISSYVQYARTSYRSHADSWRMANHLSGLTPGASSGDTLGAPKINDDVVVQSTYTNDFDFGKAGALIVNGGVYYMWQRLIVPRSVNLTTGAITSEEDKRDMNQVAAFAEGEYLINQYISTTLGLRYNYSDIFKAVPNPRFYVNINPTDWLTFKAGVTSGVRVPNLSYLYEGYTESTSGNTTTYTYGNKDLKPEESLNYELSAILDTDSAMFILTGFYTDFRNQIETVGFNGDMCSTGSTNQCRTYRNLDKSLMTGAEVSLKLKPMYGFSLDANYGFTHTEVVSFSGSNTAGENPVGRAVNSIPRHSFTITPRYSYQNFDVYLRWSGKYKTPTPTPIGTNAGRLDQTKAILGNYYKDYQLVDVAATYKFAKKYAITLAVNNLLNVNFVDLTPYSNNTNAMNNYQRILPSRNYWLTFRADF
ncbi:TonB-dependent receptor [Helicobacter jaachi]|uniref:TonB-dependent receptor n=1 Tax=Helicobacter jaachi TaxID=1677920 RepID=A0A4U8T967_9HELI|nr:TonB-dependent receptor [Helicobacter jaachi]TLD96316.1 TonB-dependent receptor [Helicobacter jaachi]